MYGNRGKIRILVPSINTALEMDSHRMAPEGISVHTARISWEAPESSAGALREMTDKAIEAAKDVAAAHVDVIVYGCAIIGSMYIGNNMLLVLNLPLVTFWAGISTIPYKDLGPIILAICIIGAYSPRNILFDIWVAVGAGVVGYIRRKTNWPIAPINFRLYFRSDAGAIATAIPIDGRTNHLFSSSHYNWLLHISNNCIGDIHKILETSSQGAIGKGFGYVKDE
jgi:hypothetical protein